MSSASKLDLPTAKIGDEIVTGEIRYFGSYWTRIQVGWSQQLSATAPWDLAVRSDDLTSKASPDYTPLRHGLRPTWYGRGSIQGRP